jgi:hypothetical protein
MKKIMQILLLTFFVLLAAGAFSNGYVYSYVAAISACVAIIVKESRYPKFNDTHIKKWVVFIVCVVAFAIYYVEYAK